MNLRTASTQSAYSQRRRQTGQSVPNISRDGPNASSATSTYGWSSAGVHAASRTSVTMPDSLQLTCGRSASARRPSAQRVSKCPARMVGLAT